MVALLRGINVGGNKRVPMPELCALAVKLGFTEVKHYINSGNLVFEAGKEKPAAVESSLAKAIEKKFGFPVDVVVRTATQWKKYLQENPFTAAAKVRPSHIVLGLCHVRCGKDVESQLNERATQGEKIKIVGDAIWGDFAKGIGTSKLTPAVFDKATGSSVTMRNWNTVLKLNELLSSASCED